MREDIIVTYDTTNNLYNKIIKILGRVINYWSSESSDDWEVPNIESETDITIFTNDGKYFEYYLYEQDINNLIIIRDMLIAKTIDSINTIIFGDLGNNTLITNNRNITIDNIKQYQTTHNCANIFGRDSYIENFFANDVNKKLYKERN